MSFVKTKGFKRFKNFIIGAGAAVVLLGALFKILSWEGANEMSVSYTHLTLPTSDLV